MSTPDFKADKYKLSVMIPFFFIILFIVCLEMIFPINLSSAFSKKTILLNCSGILIDTNFFFFIYKLIFN